MYDLGCVFEVGDRSHLWIRSDKYWHGTIRDFAVPEGALLFGTAFANKKEVTRDVLHVWHKPGAKITWRRQYDAEPHETAHVRLRKATAAAAGAAAGGDEEEDIMEEEEED